MPELARIPTAELLDHLAWIVRNSPADETEIVWYESLGARTRTEQPVPTPLPTSTASSTVRVRERRRTGIHQVGATSLSELTNAVRHAVAVARSSRDSEWIRPLASKSECAQGSEDLADQEIATLDLGAAEERFRRWLSKDECASLEWVTGRVVVVNNRDLRQAATATRCTLEIRSGNSEAGGYATASARKLADLDPENLVARARERRAESGIAAPVSDRLEAPAAAVLTPEAAAPLIEMLAQDSLSPDSFRQPRTFLGGRLGEAVFSSRLTLRDDATEPTFLPFPFDFLGYRRHELTLIREGVFETPAVDDALAEELGLDPTPLAISGEEIRPSHLDLAPGQGDEKELLAGAGDGLWIGSLAGVSYLGGPGGAFRAEIHGARRIRDGRIDGAMPALAWNDTLERVFSRLEGVGDDAVILADRRGFLGGIRTPALLLSEVTATPRS